jgi:hypothetical protein
MLPFAVLTFIGIQGYGILDALRYVFPLITLFLFVLGIRGVWVGTSRKAYEKDTTRENESNKWRAGL